MTDTLREQIGALSYTFWRNERPSMPSSPSSTPTRREDAEREEEAFLSRCLHGDNPIPDRDRLARALEAWWANDDGGMPGSDTWTERGGWIGDADAIIAALREQE